MKYLHFIIIGIIASLLMESEKTRGQEENLRILENWIEWSDGGNMLSKFLNKQAYEYLDLRDKEVTGLLTKTDWENRQRKIKKVLMQTVGPFPYDKTPLNPIITGTIVKEGYKIEKILYESLPGFYVSSCLFIPDGIGKKPAVLYVSGHYQESFRHKDYQVMILNLVKKGFIVFAIDPISQGERIQLFSSEKNSSIIGPTTQEHNYLGNKTLLSGVSLARYFIWDGIRAVDYLLTRKEVDPERIGITGQSGGGTQSSYIFAFDERIKAGAPVNYITGFRRLLESIGPQDAEQNFYHGILNGLTHADLIEVRAPSPVLIGAGTRDFFSIQGTRETFAEIRSAYKAFGKEENVQLLEDDFAHGYTVKLREGIYDFFQKNLSLPGNPKEENVSLLAYEELMVTPTGNVANSIKNARTIFDINKEESQKLINRLKHLRENSENYLESVQIDAQKLSGYRCPTGKIKSVFRGRHKREGYSIEMYALQGEGEYVIPLLVFVPESGGLHPGMVYIHPNGKIADAASGGKIEKLIKQGFVVAAPDVIGTGETKGNGSVAMLIGKSMVGIQAGDITRVANFLKSRTDVDSMQVNAVSFGEMGPTLLHAAAFNKLFNNVILIESILSYRSVVQNSLYNPNLVNGFVAGALTAYDLTDLAASVAPGELTLISPVNGKEITINPSNNLDIPIIQAEYARKNAKNNLSVIVPQRKDSFEELIRMHILKRKTEK